MSLVLLSVQPGFQEPVTEQLLVFGELYLAPIHLFCVSAEEHAVLLCECLSAISGQRSDLLPSLAPEFSQRLHHVLPSQDSPHKNKLLVSLLILLLQASLEEGLDAEDSRLVQEVVGVVDGWTAYKIGRQAARYGHHKVASEILGGLATQVGSDFHKVPCFL